MKHKLFFIIGITVLLGLSSAAATGIGDPEQGKRIYMERCVMCHGENGDGNNGMAANFREEWHRFTKSDEELARSIREGYRTPGKHYTAGAMPPQFLTDQELDDVIRYLREAFGNDSGFFQ